MHYQTEDALSRAHMQELMPIKGKLLASGYYRLRAANGEIRFVGAGNANTAWANAAWPKRGQWAVAWFNCSYTKPPETA